MAEFRIGPSLSWGWESRVFTPHALYDIGQEGKFRKKEGIYELIKNSDLPPASGISLPFPDQSILVFSQDLRDRDPNTSILVFDGVGINRRLVLLPMLSTDQVMEIRPKTIRAIDQVRSGVYRVGERNTIFIDLPDSKVGNLTLLNSPDIDFQIHPPLLSTEDVLPSRVVIDVSPGRAGNELTVLLFKELTPYRLPPDAVVIDELGSLIRKRVRRILPTSL